MDPFTISFQDVEVQLTLPEISLLWLCIALEKSTIESHSDAFKDAESKSLLDKVSNLYDKFSGFMDSCGVGG